MIFDKKPYFMSDESWYEEIDLMSNTDPDLDRGYLLTEKATDEARESYEAYYQILEADDLETQTSQELLAKAFRD